MSYLAYAISEVLSEVKILREKQRKILDQKEQLELNRKTQDQQVKQEEEEIARRTFAFQKAFPNAEDQARYFALFAKKYPLLSPNGQILRNLAISAWAAENTASFAHKATG
jgi:hypothetical protein